MFPTGWKRRHKITIDSDKVSGSNNLTNFPIVLTEVNFAPSIFSNSKNGGGDIRFSSDEAGTTQLPFAVVKWNTATSKARVYVKIPTLDHDDDTVIYVWYKNPSATALAKDDTYGSDNVFDSNYIGVFPLEGSYASLTSDARVLTPTNSPVFVDDGLDFESTSSQYADNSNSAYNLTNNYTIESFFKLESVASMAMVSGRVTDGNNFGTLYKLLVSTNKLAGNTWASSGGFLTITGATTLSADTWYHGAFTKNGTNDWKVFLNGVQDGSSTSSRTLSSTGKDGLRLGANEGSGGSSNPSTQYFDGIQREVRISDVVRSVDWLATTQENLRNPSTFATPSEIASLDSFLPKVTWFN